MHSHRPHSFRRASTTFVWLLTAGLLLSSGLVGLASCSDDDDEPFPALVSELGLVFTDEHGVITRLLLDDSTSHPVTNKLEGYVARAAYRCVCGFVRGSGQSVEIRSLAPAYILADSTDSRHRANDPVEVVSAWRGGHMFLNLYVRPLTKGGKQQWGYLRDSVRANPAGGTTYHLSLMHAQGTDTLAYSTDLYMSVPLDSLATPPAFTAADSVEMAVATWNGLRRFAVGLR